MTLAAILALALLLRLPLMTESLWFDEYYTTSDTIGSLALLLKSLYSDVHPPAYYTFMWAWVNVFGDSELSIRTPPLLCGLATIALVERLGRSFFDAKTGLVAAALVAVAPVHLWYSTEARPYSTQLLLVLLTVHAFGRLWRDDGGRGWRWTYGLALLLLVFTHYYMAAYAVAFSVLVITRPTRHRRAVLTANAVSLALMAGYVGFKLLTSEFQTEKGYLRPFSLAEGWSLFFDWFLCGHALTPDGAEIGSGRRIALHAFQALAVIAAALGVRRVLAQRTRPPAWHVLAHMLWLPLFLLGLTWIGQDKTYIERSVLPAYPFFALLLAAGLASLNPRNAIVAGFAILQLAATTAFYLEPDLHTVYRPNPDWRAAAAYLGEEIDAGHAGASIYTPYASPDPLSYYDERIQQARTFETNEASVERLLDSGVLGSWLRGWAESAIAEFEATKRQRADAMRMTVHWTHRREPSREHEGRRAFYVVYPGIYEDPEVRSMLAEPGVTVIETHRWRAITLHKLRFAE